MYKKMEFEDVEVCGKEPVYVGNLLCRSIEILTCPVCQAINQISTKLDVYVYRCRCCKKLVMEDDADLIDLVGYEGFVAEGGQEVATKLVPPKGVVPSSGNQFPPNQ